MLSEPLSSIPLWKFKFEFEYSNYNSYLIQNLIRNSVTNKDMKNASLTYYSEPENTKKRTGAWLAI